MKLSILICSLPDRMSRAGMLIEKLCAQAVDKPVEILYLGDNKTRTTGYKRNQLLYLAGGEYVVFIDDDDEVSDDYISSLLGAIDEANSPDVINFHVMYHCKDYKRPVFYSVEYESDQNLPDRFLRLPNHLMCVKSNMARAVRYKDLTFGEDAAYAKELRKYIVTEYEIEKVIYHYLDYK